MKLRDHIEALEEQKQLYATLEVHIEYLKENNRIDEAQEQTKNLEQLNRQIYDMEETELVYK